MSGSDQMISALDQAFSGLSEKAQDSIHKFNTAVQHIKDWQFVLGPVMIAIKPAIDGIHDSLDKLVKLIKTALEHHMPVVSLITQAFNWLDLIRTPLTKLPHPQGHLQYYWEGKASTAYQDKAKAQNAAIGVVASKADDVSKLLMEIAQYNVDYMAELAKMATDFLGALTTAAIEAATVIEIPFAINDLAGAIGSLVTQALDNLVGIATRFVETLSKVRALKAMMTDSTGALIQNEWPQAVNG